jgi:DNA mismatch repair protein MutL
VRFRDSGRIHGLVMSAVREVLLGHDLTPRALPSAGDNFSAVERVSMQEKLAAFFRAGSAGEPMPPLPASPSQGWGYHPGGGSFELQSQSSQPGFDYRAAPPVTPSLPSTFDIGAPRTATLAAPPGASTHAGEGTGHATTSPEGPPATPRAASALQLHNSYLVAQSDEGMVIIDQHALHERILYEELLAKVTAGPLESQRMLIPMTITASARQIDLLEQIRPLLAKLGVEAEPFGPDTVAIQAFPSFLDRLDPGDFVQELLERGEQELLDLHEEELLHEVLDMMSCKAAIKAGDPLTPQEIEALLARRELVERSSNCPHGRPTTLRLSIRDLEKQFKRTGF